MKVSIDMTSKEEKFMNFQKQKLNKIIFPSSCIDKRTIFWLLSGQWQQKSHQSSFEAAGHGQRNKQYRH
jgi:hypothetical protein